MTDLTAGTQFTTKQYEYTVTGRDQAGLCLATVRMRGQLGTIDTGITVRLVMDSGPTGPDMDALMRSSALFEAFRIEGVLCCALKTGSGTVEAEVDDGAVAVAYCEAAGNGEAADKGTVGAAPADDVGTWWSRMWNKTWRLWAALGCFALVPFTIWLIYGFFTGTGARVMRVGVLIAPVYFLIVGIGYIMEFFEHRSDK